MYLDLFIGDVLEADSNKSRHLFRVFSLKPACLLLKVRHFYLEVAVDERIRVGGHIAFNRGVFPVRSIHKMVVAHGD
jgi:hypothetical protein